MKRISDGLTATQASSKGYYVLLLLMVVGGCNIYDGSLESERNGSYVGNVDSGSTSTTSNSGMQIVLTNHARCRMACREIDLSEIEEVLSSVSGTYSGPGNGSGCPVYEYLHRTSRDNQLVEVISAECRDVSNEKVIVTVIDKERDDDPNCICN